MRRNRKTYLQNTRLLNFLYSVLFRATLPQEVMPKKKFVTLNKMYRQTYLNTENSVSSFCDGSANCEPTGLFKSDRLSWIFIRNPQISPRLWNTTDEMSRQNWTGNLCFQIQFSLSRMSANRSFRYGRKAFIGGNRGNFGIHLFYLFF